MNFQLVPDDGPPRIVRFVSSADMPNSNTVALLDQKTNVLRVARELYDQLSPEMQYSVISTQHAALEFTYA